MPLRPLATRPTRLGSLLSFRDLPKYSGLHTKYLDEYLDEHIRAGDEFRKDCGRNDAVALLGVGKMKGQRVSEKAGELGRAYVIRSLKNPAEVKTLRNIYGDSFYLDRCVFARD